MGFRFYDVATIDSEARLPWRFKECSVQYLGNQPLIPDANGQYVTFNKVALIEAEKNTNWDVSEKTLFIRKDAALKHLEGLGQPIASQPQLFLLKNKQEREDTEYLHECPGYARMHMDHSIFNDYDLAMKYVFYPESISECSLWQYCSTSFVLIHDFAWS